MNNPEERYNEYVNGIYKRAAEARSSFEYRVIKNARSETYDRGSHQESSGVDSHQGQEPKVFDHGTSRLD